LLLLDGCCDQTARMLGIGTRALQRKIREYGLGDSLHRAPRSREPQ
jgi:hypothetical protein